MTSPLNLPSDANTRLAWVLARAVEGSSRPRYEIARRAGLNKETLLRAMRGDKPISLQQAGRILGACDVPVNATLALVIAGHEKIAADWMYNGMGTFFEEFMRALPVSLEEDLGERVCELKPRWANGAARMLARTLKQHVAELDRRGDALDDHATRVTR